MGSQDRKQDPCGMEMAGTVSVRRKANQEALRAYTSRRLLDLKEYEGRDPMMISKKLACIIHTCNHISL